MRHWSYTITDNEGKVVSEHREPGLTSEKDARRSAVNAMRSLLPDRERLPGRSRDSEALFALVLTVHTDTCPPLRMGRETYSEKEILEYGTGEDLSFGELLSIAKDNYAKGGDTVYECWDQPFYDTYTGMFGPVRRKDTACLFETMR